MQDNFDHKALKEKQAEAKKQQQEQEETRIKVRKALNAYAATADGKMVLRYIFGLAGHNASCIRGRTDGAMDTDLSLVMMGRKSLYDDLRKEIATSLLAEIEKHAWEQKEDNNG